MIPARFESPRKYGTMFIYRHIDVLRVVALARILSENPKVIDVGCGNGDFTDKIVKYLPNVLGVDMNPKFAVKPFIKCMDVNDVIDAFDLAFLGWMELDEDYREPVARIASIIVSVWERGGSCGIDGDQNFDKFGLKNVASWRTPSWMNIHMGLRNQLTLSCLSFWLGVESIWDVWVKPEIFESVKNGFKSYLEKERSTRIQPYDFEHYIDEAGCPTWRRIEFIEGKSKLWEVSV